MKFLYYATIGILWLILGIRGLSMHDAFIQIISLFIGIIGLTVFIITFDSYIDEKIELLVKRIKSQ